MTEIWEMKLKFIYTELLTDRNSFVGLLKAYNADTITIENEDGSETDIDRVNVSLVRPTIDF